MLLWIGNSLSTPVTCTLRPGSLAYPTLSEEHNRIGYARQTPDPFRIVEDSIIINCSKMFLEQTYVSLHLGLHLYVYGTKLVLRRHITSRV